MSVHTESKVGVFALYCCRRRSIVLKRETQTVTKRVSLKQRILLKR